MKKVQSFAGMRADDLWRGVRIDSGGQTVSLSQFAVDGYIRRLLDLTCDTRYGLQWYGFHLSEEDAEAVHAETRMAFQCCCPCRQCYGVGSA